MSRKIFLFFLATLVLAAVQMADAQQPKKVPRIGLFHVGLDHVPAALDPLRETLKVLGYEEEKNIRLDFRNLADEEAARSTAKEFVRDRSKNCQPSEHAKRCDGPQGRQ